MAQTRGVAGVTVLYRYAIASDVDDLLHLWRRADATPSVTDSVEDIERILKMRHAHVMVAVDSEHLYSEKVIGSLITTFDGWRGNFYRMAVDPAYRHSGIARRLVDDATHWLRKQGAKRVSALVEGGNTDGQAFWRAVGLAPYDGMLRFVTTL